MSTCGTIVFDPGGGRRAWVSRGRDGCPEAVILDLGRALERINEASRTISGAEEGQAVAVLLGETYRQGERIQDYEPIPALRGDEEYLYRVRWRPIRGGGEWYLVEGDHRP